MKKTRILRPKMTIITRAYNCEKYIAETIQSVLRQTEPNFEYIIRNNGSTDKTGQIIKQFAKKDKRIIYLENRVNGQTDDGITGAERAFWPSFSGEYVTWLDADDLLAPDFIKIMYQSAKKFHADIAVSGTIMFQDGSNQVINKRIPPALQTSDMTELCECFPELYGSFRPVWGKVYRREFYEQFFDFAHEVPKGMRNGADTYRSLGYLMKCQSIVSLNGAWHYYRIRQNSSFHASKVDPVRIKAGEILWHRGHECLQALSIASEKNKVFLLSVYWGHMVDLLGIVDQSNQMSFDEKMQFLTEIAQQPLVGQLVLNRENYNMIFERFIQSMKAAEKISGISAEEQTKYFLRRLFLLNQLRNSSNETIAFLIYLSCLADERNKTLFGLSLLQEKWNGLSQGEKNFCALSETEQKALLSDLKGLRDALKVAGREDEIAKLQNTLRSYMDTGHIEKAIVAMNHLTMLDSLNAESLFFRIYLAYQSGDVHWAKLLAQVAKILCPEDEDLMTISEDILEGC